MDVINKFIRFLGVGGLATIFQYALLILFVELLFIPKVPSSIISFSLSALLNYWLNFHFTFKSNKSHKEALPKFLIIALIGLLINTCVFMLSIKYLGVYYLVAQIIATAVTLVWNFTVNNLWTFKVLKS